jgi:DnaJ-class molecular chaperone
MKDGDVKVFEQIADEAVGHIPGDLIFKIKQIPHPNFTREGNNLHMAIDISLLDALVGFKKGFTHLDGREVEVKKTSVTFCSEVFVVHNEGMPIKGAPKGRRGDLHVTLRIDFPKEFSEAQKEMIRHAIPA